MGGRGTIENVRPGRRTTSSSPPVRFETVMTLVAGPDDEVGLAIFDAFARRGPGLAAPRPADRDTYGAERRRGPKRERIAPSRERRCAIKTSGVSVMRATSSTRGVRARW